MTSINILLSIPFVFILSFSLIAFFGARYSPLQQAVEKLYYATLNVSTAKNGLIGSVNEIPKFSILRILFGLILLYNSSNVLLLATDLDLQITQFKILSIVGLIGSICILFGVLTQFTLVLFCTFQWQYGEAFLTTQSLVNDVASILAVFLFLTNAGSRISVDGILLRSNSVWLRRLLGYFNISNNEIVISKFISLTSYWLLCLYSLAKHLDERPWVEGYAGPQILTNSYVNPKWEIFDQLFNYHPIFLQFASASLWIMMLWYAVMVPFVLFGGKLRLLVVVWGVLFFALSTFVLDLRGLGEIEFLIWAAIFLYTPKKVDVYYDDKCNLCDRTVQFLKFLDITSTINLRPVSKNQEAANKLGYSTKEILSDLHFIITMHTWVMTYILSYQKR
ncbi:DUF393 domain-containing protein [Paracoccaceae bacterium]|nr:DUF393 domain-containing protein [Paracoccaceae bacterium]